ncbi:GNAT family N-acetyltransferase [Mycolicibacterium sp. NCC-Tsukiji]|uniref:GNAT family N-acetyltransferase n=1 Tax=Mycolicibacterium sp. NCC-Tsukiji TaxID=2185272 RepID=UPI000EDC866E|nr:GNAT family N-acetyltransferase [Mycolicibacterium sp. NCC-Tsukiji]GCA97763.1 N-acetyltransferase [Mycolicibacterium sp. NCC-Tsukiji]
MNPTPHIAAMTAAHAEAVLAIYQEGIDTAQATFATTAGDWAAFDAGHLSEHRYVACDDTGTVLGWVAAAPISSQCVYAGVIEHSVYVTAAARGQRLGTHLLQSLISSSENAGIWTLQCGIFPENTASLALHQRAGFRVVGTQHHLGQHHGRWRDVTLLERRSTRTGLSPTPQDPT